MSTSRATIPNNMRKMIQNIKETARNHTDEEIYAMLNECSLGPNKMPKRSSFNVLSPLSSILFLGFFISLGNLFSGFFPLMRSHTCLVLVLDFWFKGGFSFSWVTVDFFVQFELGFDGFLMLCCLFGFLGSPFSDGTETWVSGIWWGPDVFDEIFFLLAVLT